MSKNYKNNYCKNCSKRIDTFPKQSIRNNELQDHCISFVMTLDATDPLLVPQNINFNVNLTIRIVDNVINISIPALNFTLPVDGFLSTSAHHLPKKWRPQQSIPQSFTIETIGQDHSFDLYVKDDGSINIYNPGHHVIPAGTYSTNSKTISYIQPCINICPPKNYPLAEGLSQGPYNNPRAFLDFYNADYFEDVIATSWADNHDIPTPADPQNINLNCVSRVGKVVRNKDGEIIVKLQDPVTVYAPPITPNRISTAEQCISINPTDKNNLIITFILQDLNFPRLARDWAQVWTATSHDGGKTWPLVHRVDLPSVTPGLFVSGLGQFVFRADPNGQFDKFGNYWLVYMVHIADDQLDGNPIAITVSRDQGKTFEVIKIFVPPGFADFGNFFDYPRIDINSDGAGGYAIWYVTNLNRFDIPGQDIVAENWAGFVKISSTGVIDKASATLLKVEAAGENQYSLNEITVTNNGTVYLALNQIDTFFGTQQTLFKLEGGTKNYPNFVKVGPIEQNNMVLSFSPLVGFGGPPVSFQVDRGVNEFGARGIQYDSKRHRLWALFPDKHPANSFEMVLYIQFSDNDGQSWSQLIQVSNTNEKSRAIVGFKINPDNGNLLITWYDARNSPDGRKAEYAYTMIDASIADRIADHC